MKIDILPIKIVGLTATSISLAGFGIEPENKAAYCRWELLDAAGGSVLTRTTKIEGDDYAKWGTDDNYAVDFILATAGVKRAPIPESKVEDEVKE